MMEEFSFIALVVGTPLVFLGCFAALVVCYFTGRKIFALLIGNQADDSTEPSGDILVGLIFFLLCALLAFFGHELGVTILGNME